MSLINDMLRDLERRRPARDGEVLAGVHSVRQAGRAARGLPWLALGFLVLAAGTGYWLVSGGLAGAMIRGDVPPPKVEAETLGPTGTLAELPILQAVSDAPPEQPGADIPGAAVIEPTEPIEPVAVVMTEPRLAADAPDAAESLPLARWVGVDTEHRPGELRLTLRFSAAPEREPALALEDDRGRLELGGLDLAQAPPLPATSADGPLRALGVSLGDDAGLSFRVAAGVQTSLEQTDDGRQVTLAFRAPQPKSKPEPQPVARAEPPKAAQPEAPPPDAAPAVSETPAAPAPRPASSEPPATVARRSAGDHYTQALAAIRAGDNLAGERGLGRALVARPDMHEAREALATLLAADGRRGEAMAVLQEGLERAPGHTGMRGLLARLMVAEGDYNGAIRLLESGTADPHLLATLGALYQRQGRAAESAAAYRRALETDPSVGAWWAGLAIALESSGELAAAPEAYRRALRFGGLDARLDRYARERLAALGDVR